MALKARALAVAGLAAASAAAAARRRGRIQDSVRVLADPENSPRIDASGGARSVQSAELLLSSDQVAAIWSPVGLERLGLAYWRFLSHVSIGLIRVRYTETERLIVLIAWPLVLLSFDAPVYELDTDQASVRWRIAGGLLLARGGRPSLGALRIAVRRLGHPDPTRAAVRVEVAVLDFIPSIAELFGRRVYAATQSRIHVLVTSAFLRSLAGLDLIRTPTGRHAGG